jgi:Tetratricopeptide repeat.
LSDYVKNSGKVRKEDLYQLAFTQFQLEQYEDAIVNFNQLNGQNDSLGQNAMYHLGACYLKTNDKSKALNAFNSSAKLEYNPTLIERSKYYSAKLAAELGQHKNALDALKQFIIKYPKSQYIKDVKETLTDVYLNTSNYDEALKAMEAIEDKSERIKKAYQKVCYTKATELYNNQKLDEALIYFDKSTQYPIDYTQNNQAKYWKGEILYNKKKYEQAAQLLNEYINGTNENEKINNGACEFAARYTIAYCYLKKEKYDEAYINFKKLENIYNGAQAKHKSDVNIQKVYNDGILRLADCEFMRKDYIGAANHYQLIIDENITNTPYAMYQYALIKGLDGDLGNKLEMLNNLVNNFQNSNYVDDALMELGKTYSENMKWREAENSLQKLIKNYPSSPLVVKQKLH